MYFDRGKRDSSLNKDELTQHRVAINAPCLSPRDFATNESLLFLSK